jgi:hypothetical protein
VDRREPWIRVQARELFPCQNMEDFEVNLETQMIFIFSG